MTIFIFIAIALAICVALVVGMVSPRKEMIISSEVIIERPKAEVFDYVRHLRNQEKYSIWLMNNPNLIAEYQGTDGTVGFIASWKSKTKRGDAEQKIIEVNEGQSYEAELRFKDHGNITNARTTVEALGGHQTKVTTTLSSMPSFPLNMMIPLMKKMIKKDLDINSADLKKVMES